jgi:hypothetical protein
VARPTSISERTWTAIATIIAAIAALAASFQSYLAWSGRNDVLKASVIAALVQVCADASAESADAMLVLRNYDDKEKLETVLNHLVKKATGVLIIGSAMEKAGAYDDFVKRGTELQTKLMSLETQSTTTWSRSDRDELSDKVKSLEAEIAIHCHMLFKSSALNPH